MLRRDSLTPIPVRMLPVVPTLMVLAWMMAIPACSVSVTDAGGGGGTAADPNGPGDGDAGGGDDGSADDGAGDQAVVGPAPLDVVMNEAVSTTAALSAEAGGSVSLPGAQALRLDVPPGALTGDAMVSLMLLESSDGDPYATGVIIESTGGDLSAPATVVIPLNPPLSGDTELRILLLPTGDPGELLDTGLLAEISADGSEAYVAIDSLGALAVASPRQGSESGGGKTGVFTRTNCHGSTLRDVVSGLGRDAATIEAEIRAANGPEFSEAEYAELRANLNQVAGGELCFASPRQVQAVLRTYYQEEPVSERLNGRRDASGNLEIEEVTSTCLNGIESTSRGSSLPPVILQNGSFEKDAGTGLYSGFAHSATIVQEGGQAKIRNGLSISVQHARQLSEARMRNGENPEAVLSVPLVGINGLQRTQRSGEVFENEMRRLGTPIQFGGRPLDQRPQPYSAIRIFTPRETGSRNQQPTFAVCSIDDVVELPLVPMYQVFRVTNYQAFGFLTVRTTDSLDAPPLLSSFPGGGIDAELRAEWAPFGDEVFATPEEAARSLCPRFVRFYRPVLASFIQKAQIDSDAPESSAGVDGIFVSECPDVPHGF